MCGLAGACGPSLSQKDREAVTQLMELSKVRGRDSTGLFTVLKPDAEKTRGLKYRTYKDVVESPAFMASKTVKAMLADEPCVIGGHTRLATHGKINVSNAHPYTVGHYIGTHNGVIPDLYDRVNDKTDSEILFTNMMKDGVIKGIRSGLDLGDMALVFINKSNSTLNYFRNGGRPLFIGVEEKKKKFFWSSSKDFLEFIEKHRLTKFSNLYSVEPYMLHSVNLFNLKVEATEIKSDKPKQHFIPSVYGDWSTPYVMSPVNQQTLDENLSKLGVIVADSNPTNGLYSRSIKHLSKPLKVATAVTLPAPAVKQTPKTVFFRGFNDTLIDPASASMLMRGNGCCCDGCGAKEYSIFKTIWWLSPTRWLCNDCKTSDTIVDICYQGETFFKGCLVRNDKDIIVKQPTHPENEIPF